MELKLTNKKLFEGFEIECYEDVSREDGDFFMSRKQISQALEYENERSFHMVVTRKQEKVGKPLVNKLLSTDGKYYDTELYSFEQFFELIDGNRQPKADAFRKWAIATLKELVTGRAELKFKRQEDKDKYEENIKYIIEEAIQGSTKPLYDKINEQNKKLDEQSKVIYLNNNKIDELQTKITNVEESIIFKQNINPRYLFEFFTAQYFVGQNKTVYTRGFYDDLANWLGIKIPHANELPNGIRVRDYIVNIVDINEIEFFVKGVLSGRIIKSEKGNFVDLQGIFSNNIEIEKIKRNFKYECAYCTSKEDLVIEHLIPQNTYSKSYPELTDLIHNCTIVCQECNGKRNNIHPMTAWYKSQPFYDKEKLIKLREHWNRYVLKDEDEEKLHKEIKLI